MTAKDAISELVKSLRRNGVIFPCDEHAILIALDRKEGAS